MQDAIIDNEVLISTFMFLSYSVILIWQALKKDRVVSNNIAMLVLFFVTFWEHFLSSNLPLLVNILSYDSYSTIWHISLAFLSIGQVFFMRIMHKIYQETRMHLAVFLEAMAVLYIVNFAISFVVDIGFQSSAYGEIRNNLLIILNVFSMLGCYAILIFSRQISSFVIWLDEKSLVKS